jgi:hypothetical protein
MLKRVPAPASQYDFQRLLAHATNTVVEELQTKATLTPGSPGYLLKWVHGQ